MCVFNMIVLSLYLPTYHFMFEYFNVEYSEKYRIKLKLLKTLPVIVDHDSKKKNL